MSKKCTIAWTLATKKRRLARANASLSQALIEVVRGAPRDADADRSGRPEPNVAIEPKSDRLLDEPALLVDADAAAPNQHPIDSLRTHARGARDVGRRLASFPTADHSPDRRDK
jgi:hypothetical protein